MEAAEDLSEEAIVSRLLQARYLVIITPYLLAYRGGQRLARYYSMVGHRKCSHVLLAAGGRRAQA